MPFLKSLNRCFLSGSRKSFFGMKHSGVFLALLCAGPGILRAADPSPGPNILILLADDLGYADIGVNGCPDFATPNIDSIARNGVRFTSGYVSGPVCSPSRAGLMTGRCQTRFGHEFNHATADLSPFGLPASVKTAAQWFQEAGYATGHIGKWHLGSMRNPEFRPENRGFGESVWFPGQDKLPPLFYFRHNGDAAPGNPGNDPGIERTAKFFFDREDPKFREAARADDPYVDAAMVREARQFIGRNESRPWFLYVAFLTPHTPLTPPPGSEDSSISEVKRRKCAAMMTVLDRGIGEVMLMLRDSGQEERTLVVFLSDNGAVPANGSGNTPLKGYKGTLWEGGIRVPFVMQWRGGGIPAGKVVDAPVSSLDILPTALAAAGIPVPADACLDGVDLLPFLTGKSKEPPHEALFWRYGDQRAVRQGDWKLVRTLDGGRNPTLRQGLYNLLDDIGEKKDVSTAEPGKAAELQAKWDEWNAGNIKALWEYESPVDAR